jgi:hypothetical protein
VIAAESAAPVLPYNGQSAAGQGRLSCSPPSAWITNGKNPSCQGFKRVSAPLYSVDRRSGGHGQKKPHFDNKTLLRKRQYRNAGMLKFAIL